MRSVPLILVLLGVSSCTGPARPPATTGRSAPASAAKNDTTPAEQISRYIRCSFQDRDGNLWFGTTSDGVVRYEGRSLHYFNAANEFGSDWVSAISQDDRGELWFGTRDGVVRYDGTKFTRYTTKDGLVDDRIWCVLPDRNGSLWFGTEEGVSRFDGRTFTSFPIPAADLSQHPYYEGPKRINCILEDKAGNIWFATNGGGAYRYDGKTLANLSLQDGLCDNFVQAMLEDRDGNLWFGTRFGGLCKYDGNSFSAFMRQELKGDNVGVLYQERNGTLWIGVNARGLCRYYGTTLTCYDEKDGAGIRVIISVLEDDRGQLWFGTGAGLYRFSAGRFTNWTKEDALGR